MIAQGPLRNVLAIYQVIGASIEAFFSRRLNVIRFLVGRYLFMVAMFLFFWLANRAS
ncbi:MAG: hypothetical protein RLZZ624_57 [Cyanobacteriota bacterium]|jgi:hypothetical protein